MTTDEGLWLPARAKLNLVLRVVGRRADGYHLLETLFHAIDLHDDVWLGRGAPGIRLQVTADDERLAVPAGDDNLVVRALRQLAAAVGVEPAFAVRLHKRIPHGAGLGGGSSDAAAALRLGRELLGAPAGAADLARLAAGLGADVPFFLRGGSQWGRGIGDELAAAHVAPRHFVLVVPPFGCPTAEVYKNHAAHWQSGRPQVSVPSVTGPDTRDSAVHAGFCNDLEAAAERVRPELAALRAEIERRGGHGVRMTGSGSALFLAFEEAGAAAACAARLRPLTAQGVRLLHARSVDGLDPVRRAPAPSGPGGGQRRPTTADDGGPDRSDRAG
ncbi:MAG: 4-(cytidine 5'-diphospho)-2-C-methyl-D-erythritol kinase [Planctomycetes bacterium]|nr:4-(cytidine 5'-diphospho)-2-C-methyl-D-erythritol kinase [Planctomycetota bacterium]